MLSLAQYREIEAVQRAHSHLTRMVPAGVIKGNRHHDISLRPQSIPLIASNLYLSITVALPECFIDSTPHVKITELVPVYLDNTLAKTGHMVSWEPLRNKRLSKPSILLLYSILFSHLQSYQRMLAFSRSFLAIPSMHIL